MSDLMREEFEAWFLANAPKLSEKASWLDPDAMAIRRLARHAWQASRECLVIELPDTKEIMPLSPGMYVHEMRKIVDENKYTRAIDLARCAIHAAGVKTK